VGFGEAAVLVDVLGDAALVRVIVRSLLFSREISSKLFLVDLFWTGRVSSGGPKALSWRGEIPDLITEAT
jgi:hypothetical protein